MLDVFAPIERQDGKKTVWPRVGAAFKNRDGSLTLVLDALPVQGRLVVQKRKEEPAPAPVAEDDIAF